MYASIDKYGIFLSTRCSSLITLSLSVAVAVAGMVDSAEYAKSRGNNNIYMRVVYLIILHISQNSF